MFLNCTSSFLLRLVPDVGSSNCRSTPRVHIESRVPHLGRSGAMFATIGQLGFHARTANVRTAPSSRNASPTGRPVTLLCTALMPPLRPPPRHTGPCTVCIAETGICAFVVLRSHNLLHAQAVQICPTSSHPQADDDCSPASASKFGGADTLAILELLLALRRVVAVCDHHVLMRLHTPHCTSPYIAFVVRLSDRTRTIGLSELHTYGSHTTICTFVSSLSVCVKPKEVVHWNLPTFSSCRGESSWLQQSLARRTHAA